MDQTGCLKTPFLITVFFLLSSTFAWAEGEKTVIFETNKSEQVMEILRTGHILTFTQRQKFDKLINELSLEEDDAAVLDQVLKAIVAKIDKDRSALQTLLTYVTKLRNNRYARTVGRIKEADVRFFWELFDELELSIKDKSPDYTRLPDPPSVDDYIFLIQRNSALLQVGYSDTTIVDVWEFVRERLQGPYAQWNKKFVELKQRERKGEIDKQRVLNLDEANFLENFNIVQGALRRLAEDSSKEF